MVDVAHSGLFHDAMSPYKRSCNRSQVRGPYYGHRWRPFDNHPRAAAGRPRYGVALVMATGDVSRVTAERQLDPGNAI